MTYWVAHRQARLAESHVRPASGLRWCISSALPEYLAGLLPVCLQIVTQQPLSTRDTYAGR